MDRQVFPLSKKEAEEAGIEFTSGYNKNALFPTILRDERSKKGVSQAAMAEIIGVTKSTIGLYETGDNVPDVKTLYKMAGYFNVTCDYLVGKSEIPLGNADDMAIEKRLHLTKEAINNLANPDNHYAAGFGNDTEAYSKCADMLIGNKEFRRLIGLIINYLEASNDSGKRILEDLKNAWSSSHPDRYLDYDKQVILYRAMANDQFNELLKSIGEEWNNKKSE